jgi:hypothetical protein
LSAPDPVTLPATSKIGSTGRYSKAHSLTITVVSYWLAHRRRAAEQSDERATFQLIVAFGPLLAKPGPDLQDIELA